MPYYALAREVNSWDVENKTETTFYDKWEVLELLNALAEFIDKDEENGPAYRALKKASEAIERRNQHYYR